ncbi:hypothetical protein JCM30237_27050 [Halolamina litorea]
MLSGLPTAATLSALLGAFLAGVVSTPDSYDGAVEGAVAAGVAVPLTMVGVGIARYVAFQGLDSPMQALWITGGPQAIAGLFVVFPLALAVGALVGWLGRLARDLASGGVSLAGS